MKNLPRKKATGFVIPSNGNDGRLIRIRQPSIAPIVLAKTPLDLFEKTLLTLDIATSSDRYDSMSMLPIFDGIIHSFITS